MNEAQTSHSDPRAAKLPRVLGSAAALSMVVGSVIGSGIFIVPARVANAVPGIGPIVLLWVAGGIFSLAGALTLAELGAMLPQAGGPYVYLREAYGKLMAFLFGWTEFLVIRAGSMATLAAAFALYFARFFADIYPALEGPYALVWQTLIAVCAITTLAIINVIGTKISGGVQVAGTVLKVGVLTLMIVLPFFLGKADTSNLSPVWLSTFEAGTFAKMMGAMVGILWTYDGWVNTSELSEEIKDPGRNVPRALLRGMAILITVYLAMTLVYHLVLPMNEISAVANVPGSPRVIASDFFDKLGGRDGVRLVALIVMCSTFISLNGNALAGPRAYFAMSRDGLFPQWLSRVHQRFQTPANAIIAQSVWAILLTVLGAVFLMSEPPKSNSGLPAWVQRMWATLNKKPLYDVMYEYVIFGGTIIYTLTITSVFVLRKTRPDLPRPYRTWGYPVTPIVYVGASLLLLYSMLDEDRRGASLTGLGIILLGIPAYFLFARNLSTAIEGSRGLS